MNRGSTDVYVHNFTHLKDMPREKEALDILKKVASLVKPIMRKHNWHLPVLAEFFPSNPGLLGLNINGGEKICIRLRPYFDKNAFLPEHDIIGCMLHELTHNVHGPHDSNFYQFLSKLEDEFDALRRSGYAGEGFYSNGYRLGGNSSRTLSHTAVRRKAAEAAERRQRVAVIMDSAPRRIGGGEASGKPMRQVLAEAAERRIRDEKSCASGHEAQREADTAARDGIIDEALYDFYPEEPEEFIIISDDSDDERLDSSSVIFDARGSGPSKVVNKTKKVSCHACTFLNPASAKSCEMCDRPLLAPRPVQPKPNQATRPTSEWSCPACTLVNANHRLQCDACGSKKPLPATSAAGWTCSFCGDSRQSHEFWTCRTCGTIKDSSSTVV